MSLDFQQVRQQVKALGEGAQARFEERLRLYIQARQELERRANDFDFLRRRVQFISSQVDPNLRCALPAFVDPEPLNACFSLPPMPSEATLLAADGSQITPDRHGQVNFCLINIGVIRMQIGSPTSPLITTRSELIGGDALYSPGGIISEQQLALRRDLMERIILVELARSAASPVITLTDGPIELWGTKDGPEGGEYQRSLESYLSALEELRGLDAATAGYVDKPSANLVVRLLETAVLDESDLHAIRSHFPLRGVTDRDIFNEMLAPGERSAVFAIQSRGQLQYPDEQRVHFFYLNVGRTAHPWPVRVEIPAWVASNSVMLNSLQAALISQCRILGLQPFPYILHRAHEAAVVTFEERDQVMQMIVSEMRYRGVTVDEISHKQFAKNQSGRTRFAR